jgi:hypothetical protein
MAPYAVELSALAAILIFGRLSQLLYLAIGAAVLTIVWHVFTVKSAQRQARQFELAEARQPASSVAFSLQTRRLGGYTNFKIEAFIAAFTLCGLGWLAHQRINDPEESLHGMFALPFLLVYLQLGLLLIKRGLIAWRTAIPSDQANDHLEWREHVRRHYLELCDAMRLIFAGGVLMAPIRYALNPQDGSWLKTALTLGWFACASTVLIWATRSRRVVLEAMRRSQPVKLPDSGARAASCVIGRTIRWRCSRVREDTRSISPAHPPG